MQAGDRANARGAEGLVDQVRNGYRQLREQVAKTIVGMDVVIEQLLICLFCGGHAVLVGVPGLAKTLLVSTVARAVDLTFSRIQFTPDLMPSDITGTEVIEEDRSTGRRELRFVRGPVFGNVILADEINRTPPKTQAALLEAMQERHVTVSGQRHGVPEPFFVFATQNPIEQEGTYPLPEAQLDRFMFMIHVGYPASDQELEIIKRTTVGPGPQLSPVLDGQQVQQIQALVRDIPVAGHVAEYAIRLVRATRAPEAGDSDERPPFVRDYVSWGAGPRSTQALVLAGKARAVLHGRTHASIEDVRALAHPVLRHRLVLNFAAEADGVKADGLIDRLLEQVEVGSPAGGGRGAMDAVIR